METTHPDRTCAEAREGFRRPTPPAAAGLRAQFGRPSGLGGWLVGHLMAVKNGARSRFVLGELGAREGNRVLEIGFGPGVDIARAAALVGPRGSIVGIDPSDEMARQARARNRRAMAEGRVQLVVGSACALPFDDGSFDRVFTINAVQFWEDLVVGLCEVRRVLRPGGVAAIAIQPRNRGAGVEDTARWEHRLVDGLTSLGLYDVRATRDQARPAPTVCAVATR